MGLQIKGHVLEGARIAPTNSPVSGEPDTGVLRDLRPVPDGYVLQGDAPAFVDPAADQYRAAILDAAGTTPTEYIVWAQNTSQLALVDDPSWWTEDGVGTIPQGDVPVGSFVDGSTYIVVRDRGNRSIAQVLWVVVARGDVSDYDDEGWVDLEDPSQGRKGDHPYLAFSISADDQNASAGIVRLDAYLNDLAGATSVQRGDRVVAVRYTIAPARFWWTRNDRYETRFGWNDRTRRWEPYKGSCPKNLGPLLPDTTYQLDPKILNLPLDAYLPGDAGNPDSYAMIRLGATPGASDSTPLDHVRIKADDVVSGFDFSQEPLTQAVVGRSTGLMVFNPTMLADHAGKQVWYIYKGFSARADGVVGPIMGSEVAPLFIAPLPGPTDFPFLRFGNRAPLQVVLTDTDVAQQQHAEPDPGSVIVSMSTGRLRFRVSDVWRADPSRPEFDKHFLGEFVIYDGVALNGVPQSVRPPVRLVNDSGATGSSDDTNLYVPDLFYMPSLGQSGIVDAPDGTGALPAHPELAADVRAGGDNGSDPRTGRVRRVGDSIGDTVVFARHGAVATLHEVDHNEDLPVSAFLVPQGEAWIARVRSTHGSKVVISQADRDRFHGSHVYFGQLTLTPSTYTNHARLYSRIRDVFRFQGGEHLYFAIDGVAYQWDPTTLMGQQPEALFFTPDAVASSLQNDSTFTNGTGLPSDSAFEQNGRVVLGGSTSIEIGFGTGGIKDLSGCTVLGFMPGWRAIEDWPNWIPDSGVSLGLSRSPLNLDRSQATADYAAWDRVEDLLISKGVQASPFMFLDNVPLQDVAGVADGVYFNIATQITDGDTVQVVNRPLIHYKDIIHRFQSRKFDWVARNVVDGTIDYPTTTLGLGQPAIIPESMLGAPGIGGGLYVAQSGDASSFQVLEDDYVMPQGGTSGTAIFVDHYGKRVATGARGSYAKDSGHFVDLGATFLGPPVMPGYRLKITAGAHQGSYIIQEVISGTELIVSPVFLGASTGTVTWEVATGFTDDVYDPTLVADLTFQEFGHLPEEPFKVRLLTSLGLVSASDDAPQLKANPSAAIRSGRTMGLRFGRSPDHVATLSVLKQTILGKIGNGVLAVPIFGVRFQAAAFSIHIDGSTYTPGSGLVAVQAFSPDPVGIEYLTESVGDDPVGRLKFGSSVMSDHGGADVLYVEEFLGPGDMTAGTAELDPVSGLLGLAQSDIDAFAGAPAFFVEEMVTEKRRDVSISPMLGAFTFHSPVPKGSLIEVSYWMADLEGRKVGSLVTEFLPVFIRNESAINTRPNTFTFNNDGQTIDTRVAPTVFVGAMMQNFGATDYILDYPNGSNGVGRVTFITKTVAPDTIVKVSYAVLEAQGGERSFEASQKNLYRPPFFIKSGQTQFGLRGDRTSEFMPGQLIRIGEECFYVQSTRYFPQVVTRGVTTGDVTAVGIFPGTITEVGSRAPGNDVLTVITQDPVTSVVDPDGASPVATAAPAGFMSTIDVSVFPFDPVSRGQTTIVFQGDMTQFAVQGHILELGGYPHTIANAERSEDGNHTRITVTSGFRRGFDVSERPTVKLSYRPVYPPSTRDFLGVGPVLTGTPVDLVIYGEHDRDGHVLPGRTLQQGTHYHISPDTGGIALTSPWQDALGPGQKLSIYFTRVRVLQPVVKNRAVVRPRFTADYLSSVIPSDSNGFLGSQITATYTFSSPDTFYFRTVGMPAFLGDAAKEAVRDITSRQVAGGSLKVAAGGTRNWEQGRLGILGERHHLTNQDRAARIFLAFYNATVVALEQITETISGGFVGDRSGKFRFWIGTGLDVPTPGYEDDISGTLTPRNVWSAVAHQANPNLTFSISSMDPVVTPESAVLLSGQVSGNGANASTLDRLMIQQRGLGQNDIDDIVLAAAQGTIIPDSQPPYFRATATGEFLSMGSTHRFSRIFPTLTKAFLRLDPGAGANPIPGSHFNPGVYTAGRMIDGQWVSTHGQVIGRLANPVLGPLSLVSHAGLAKRRARARVWGYFPQGFVASQLGAPGDPDIPLCIIAFPGPLNDVPINPSTGYPDPTVLLSQGGDVPDLASGDPGMAVPGFETGDQVYWGTPEGFTYPLYARIDIDIYGEPTYSGVFIRDVRYGCVLTFTGKDSNNTLVPITDPNTLLLGSSPATGMTLHEVPAQRGDTIFVGAPTGEITQPPADPPTFSTFQQVASAIGGYRVGFDVDIRATGQIVDITLPSKDDPSFSAAKELFGQNPPEPMSTVEGPVEFSYTSQLPLMIPALFGGIQDDAGDIQIPYIRAANTELDRFDQVSAGMVHVMTEVDDSLVPVAVYPDEILGNDGSVSSDPLNDSPAVFRTALDVRPIVNGQTDMGIGDARAYDLMMCQVPGSVQDSKFIVNGQPNLGPCGILSLGSVENDGNGGSLVSPPRFVTSTATRDLVRYTMDNAMVYVSGPYPDHPQAELLPPPGIQITEDALNAVTTLDGESTAVTFYDGETAGNGGLNSLWAASEDNVITIRLIARKDLDVQFGPAGIQSLPNADPGGMEALRIIIRGHSVECHDYQGNVYGPINFVGSVDFGVGPAPHRQIRIPVAGLIPWGPGAGLPSQWFLPHTHIGQTWHMLYGFEFAIDIDTRLGQSDTAGVLTDRLTFSEALDFRWARSRGTVHPQSQVAMETRLVVREIAVGKGTIGWYWASINRHANGLDGQGEPIPFTFLPMHGALGTWAPAAGLALAQGTIRVPAFEGHGNVLIDASDVTFTVMPSNSHQKEGIICAGSGKTGSRFNTQMSVDDQQRLDNRVCEVTLDDPAMEGRVQPGDVLIINGSNHPDHAGTVHMGSYIVRHAVWPNDVDNLRKLALATQAGTEQGWCPLHFPTVVSFDVGTDTFVVSDLAPVSHGSLVNGYKTGFTLDYNPGNPIQPPRVYVLVSIQDLGSPVEATFRKAVVSARYTLLESPNGTGVFTVSDYRDAVGTPISGLDFSRLIQKGDQVSGMMYWPLSMTGSVDGLPDTNCVGYDVPSNVPSAPVYGFRGMTFSPVPALKSAGAQDISFGDGGALFTKMPTEIFGHIALTADDPIVHEFQSDPQQAVYHNVPRALSVRAMDWSMWETINVPPGSFGGGGNSLVRCILPGTRLMTQRGNGDPGFWAQAGIFLEPSCPRSSLDLLANHPRVVDQSHSLPNPTNQTDPQRELGMRDGSYYWSSGVIVASAEEVRFSVRRIRRFHDPGDVTANLRPLRFAYEIRRGRITTYTVTSAQHGIVGAGPFAMDWETTKPPGTPKAQDIWNDGTTDLLGTHLGTFTDPNVNVHAGDDFRLLDANGRVVARAEILSVISYHQLKLAAPGLNFVDAGNPSLVGYRFEIFVRHAPVPHEQTNEQLLDLMTDREVARTDADWETQLGGYVPDLDLGASYVANRLYDDLNAPGNGRTFGVLGVRQGDIVIVDPAGWVPMEGGQPDPQERGAMASGDRGVQGRLDASGQSVYVRGTPNPLDDNRGFYRVTKVVDTSDPPYLTVDPVSTFTGTGDAPVIFDSADDHRAFAVYPTVTDSALKQAPYADPGINARTEGQQDLRPTRVRDPVTKSFRNPSDGRVGHSIRPFSYRVIRPSKLFTDRALDIVLSNRERMLSLIEMLQGVTTGRKLGDYFTFQRDGHVLELGDPADADVGLGILSNAYIRAVIGRVDVVPFSNTERCLSLLDRRFWVMDGRLDSLTFDSGSGVGMKRVGPGDTPYTAYHDPVGGRVRPLLPDLVDEILDRGDRFRAVRYVWLAYRAHRTLGTLAGIARFDQEIPDRINQQNRAIAAAASLGNA